MSRFANISLENTYPIILVEAQPGPHRRDFLEREIAARKDFRTSYLNCGLAEQGSWAGVNSLFRRLLPEIELRSPHLVIRHDYELTRIMPELRTRIKVRNTSLTDDAMGDERVRNYPVDRAFRILQGLIDLLKEWRSDSDQEPWLLVCDNYDRAGALVASFFIELARRGGPALGIKLVLVCDPGQRQIVSDRLDLLSLPYTLTHVDLPQDGGPAEPGDHQIAREQALALQKEACVSMTHMEIHYPELLRLWQAAGDEQETFNAYVIALAFCNHNGFYHDGVYYADYVHSRLERYVGDDQKRRWYIIGLLFHPYAVTGQPMKALEIYREQDAKLTNHELRARFCYSMSMLYARFLDDRNIEIAEEYLMQGLAHLEEAELTPESLFFLRVFLRNGLALIRIRQGLPDEAVQLCAQGFECLEQHLDPCRHRLHRSVLLYNTAQVYSRTGRNEQALEYYALAIGMDPHYSEYYNERGNILQQLGRYQAALAEYEKAIQLSPPYHEVFFNMGICYQRLGLDHEAIGAFTRAVDIFPNQPHAYLNRAAIWETTENLEAAYLDYSNAIKWSENPAEVYANRAVLLFQMNRLEESLADLNAAIEGDPDCADFYLNRAVALEALDRPQSAASDLQRYLQLSPQAPDRNEVRARLKRLAA